jgi:dolichol kinase
MTSVIIVFAILTMLAGAVIIINPDTVYGILRNNLERPGLQLLAVIVRIVLGVLLVYLSAASKFPLAIEILGWVSLAAALILALIGRHRFKGLMNWALARSKPVERAGGVAAVCFGGFLLYAFV